jgi:hypothetical protein
MRKLMSVLVLSASFIGLPAVVGCDREISHEETVKKTPDGGTKVHEETVTKKADGSIEKKTETNKVP